MANKGDTVRLTTHKRQAKVLKTYPGAAKIQIGKTKAVIRETDIAEVTKPAKTKG